MMHATAPVAIVTGAASGLGAGIAARLVHDGAHVFVSDVNEEAAKATAAALGKRATGLRIDVTDRASVDTGIAHVLDTHGTVDVLVNNAGWDAVGPFVDSSVDEWDRIVSINLYGTLHMCQAVMPALIAQGGGSIVNIGSDAARVGSTGEAVYSATKGGVVAFTKTIARELARHGVRANAVCPGPSDTPLFAGISAENPKLRASLERSIPLRRLAQPADIAAAVAFLASDDSVYITGQTISVSGGLTMV